MRAPRGAVCFDCGIRHFRRGLWPEAGGRAQNQVLPEPHAPVDHLGQAGQLHHLWHGPHPRLRRRVRRQPDRGNDLTWLEFRERPRCRHGHGGARPVEEIDALAAEFSRTTKIFAASSPAFYDGRIDGVFVEHNGKFVTKGNPGRDLQPGVARTSSAICKTPHAAETRPPPQMPPSASSSTASAGSRSTASPNSRAASTPSISSLPSPETCSSRRPTRASTSRPESRSLKSATSRTFGFTPRFTSATFPDLRIGQKVIARTPSVPGRDFPASSLSSTRDSICRPAAPRFVLRFRTHSSRATRRMG